MELFKGYVLMHELYKKANVSNALFRQMELQFKKMGRDTCILKESLPLKYKEIAEKECLDLEEYYGFCCLSIELGMSKDYLSAIAKNKPFESKKIGGSKLFKLSEEFIKNINKGLNPYKIKNKEDEEYAKQIIEMQGLKIGFY